MRLANPAALIAAATLTATLTGCATTPPTTVITPDAPTATTYTEPINPTIIAAKLDGCELPPGVTEGTRDERGNRSVECSYLTDDGNPYAFAVITTWPVEMRARDAAPEVLDPPMQPDMESLVIGDGFAVQVADTTMTTISADKIAAQTGGQVAR